MKPAVLDLLRDILSSNFLVPLLLLLVSFQELHENENKRLRTADATDADGGTRTWSHIHFGARELELGGKRATGERAVAVGREESILSRVCHATRV